MAEKCGGLVFKPAYDRSFGRSLIAREATKALTEDNITSTQALLSNLGALRNLNRAALVPDHCSGLEKGDEVSAFSSNSDPH